jgi:hypothetical protein
MKSSNHGFSPSEVPFSQKATFVTRYVIDACNEATEPWNDLYQLTRTDDSGSVTASFQKYLRDAFWISMSSCEVLIHGYTQSR